MRRSSLTDPASDPELDAAVARVREADLVEEAAEAIAAFHLRMRARGIQDLAVLRAFELVPRHAFVPHRYLDLVSRDLALPIGCGQTQNEPWLVARMIEALRLEPAHRVLEIGSGTGYATAILAHLCAEVMGLERFGSLALAAQARLVDLKIANAAVVWGDGLAVPLQIEPFDRILVHGLLKEVPSALLDRLAPTGVIVCARPAANGQAIVRLDKSAEAEDPLETVVCGCRFQPIQPGLAATL